MIAPTHSEVFERIARESEPDLIGDESVECSALQMLAELRAGKREAKSLDRAERRAIVEYLTAEGQTTSEMALLLKVNDRTIQRDRHYIRSRNGVFQDTPGFVPRLAGDLMTAMESSIARIRRACRKPNVKASEVIAAERAVVDITVKVTRALQTLGYAPNIKPQDHDNITIPPHGRLEPPPQSMTPLRRYALHGGPFSLAKMRDHHKPATPKSEWLARFGIGLGFVAHARSMMEEARKEAAIAAKQAFDREVHDLVNEMEEAAEERAWFAAATKTEESQKKMVEEAEVQKRELRQRFAPGSSPAPGSAPANNPVPGSPASHPVPEGNPATATAPGSEPASEAVATASVASQSMVSTTSEPANTNIASEDTTPPEAAPKVPPKASPQIREAPD